MPVSVNSPTYLVTVGPDGQLTVYEVVSGNLSELQMNQLFSAQRDIAGAVKLVEAMIVRNLT